MPLKTLDSFSPIETHSESKSTHPKTTANRIRIQVKEGLDLADHRANAVFHAIKCRQIKRLHRHPQWASWSDRKKKSMEDAIIRKLEERRDRKKQENEIEFSIQWKKGEYEEVAVEDSANENDEEKGTAMPQVDEEVIDPSLSVELVGRGKEMRSQKRKAVKRSVKESTESNDERSTSRKRAKRRYVRKSLTPKDEGGGDDDDEWITDDGIVAGLWAMKEEGGKAFFAQLDELEKTAKEAYAEFMDKLAAS